MVAKTDRRLVRADAEEETKTEERREDASAGTQPSTEIMDAVERCMDAVERMADSFSKRMDSMEERMKKRDADEDEGEEDRADKLNNARIVKRTMQRLGKRKDAAEDVREEKATQAADEDAEKEDAEEEGAEGREMGDPKRVAADGRRKDADGDLEAANERKEKEEAHADAVSDQVLAMIRRELEPLKRTLGDVVKITPRPITDSEAEALLRQQAMADDVFVEHGKRAPSPMLNETLGTYRKRLMRELQRHSPSLKDADLWAVNDSAVLDQVERTIYADAVTAARTPASAGPLQVRAVTREHGGHTFTEYHGDSAGWMGELALPATRGFVSVGDMMRATKNN